MVPHFNRSCSPNAKKGFLGFLTFFNPYTMCLCLAKPADILLAPHTHEWHEFTDAAF